MDAKLIDRATGAAVAVLLLPEFGAGQVPGIVEFAGRMFVLGDTDGRPSSCLAEAHYYEALVYRDIPTKQKVSALPGGQPVELASECGRIGRLWALGKLAYNAYRKHTGGVSLATGQQIPEFEGLNPAIRDAWAVAASAVFEAALRLEMEGTDRG